MSLPSPRKGNWLSICKQLSALTHHRVPKLSTPRRTSKRETQILIQQTFCQSILVSLPYSCMPIQKIQWYSWLLGQFALIPETSSKHLIRNFKIGTLSSSPSIKINVSSQIWRWALTLSVPAWKPLNSPLLSTLFKILAKRIRSQMKQMGDRGSPCLRH